ncbi:hypothetical protein K490DRAFT_37226 [Saccharata proteae CBS 121410]|uniref:WW-domain-binding protein n=1 Tax=Saccharata proteae CBS 121410 TaxID=1314787 RepID=A0A6A5YD02_9PEZI|nr:hypothetical protein K490DRAFT_37226 [Saccharata proteae CBS 121410]
MLKRINSWVMLSPPDEFVLLPNEQRIYTSPPRTTLTLQTLHKYPGKSPFCLSSSAGRLHLTNRRIVYLPSTPTPQLQSFAAPILNLHDTHVTAPFFGPNVWAAVVQPVPGGNIPPQHTALELKMTFKDGGAFDFHTAFERIKERLQQAVEVAHISGDGQETGDGRGAGALAGVDLENVHLDELPAYEAGPGPAPPIDPSSAAHPRDRDSGLGMSGEEGAPKPSPGRGPFEPPVEPPPGYEEVQRESVNVELERRLRRESEEGLDQD